MRKWISPALGLAADQETVLSALRPHMTPPREYLAGNQAGHEQLRTASSDFTQDNESAFVQFRWRYGCRAPGGRACGCAFLFEATSIS